MQDQKITIAKIGKKIGLKGEFKLHLYGEIDSVQLQAFQPLFLCLPEQHTWQPLAADAFSVTQGRISFRAPYANATINMVHSVLAVTQTQLPPLPVDTFYAHDLLGKTVVNPEGVSFGRVTALMNHSAHDILFCLEGKSEYLIPFINAYIVSIDAHTITVLWHKDYS